MGRSAARFPGKEKRKCTPPLRHALYLHIAALLFRNLPGEAEADEEGKQTMRALARNMIFLMQSIALGKEQFGLPEKEPRVSTNFIR